MRDPTVPPPPSLLRATGCCPPPPCETAGACETTGPSLPLDPGTDERLAAFARALAHPHRVHILRFLLAQRACFAGEIADRLPIAASTVSQHLAQLKESGLVRGEADGPRRCYCVDPEALALLKQLVAAL